MRRLRRQVTDASRSWTFQGTVLSIVNNKLTIDLGHGRVIRLVPLYGGQVVVGDPVLVDYSSGRPMAMALEARAVAAVATLPTRTQAGASDPFGTFETSGSGGGETSGSASADASHIMGHAIENNFGSDGYFRYNKVMDLFYLGSAGDMYKTQYDTDNDNIVENSDKLEGHAASYFATADHIHSEYLDVPLSSFYVQSTGNQVSLSNGRLTVPNDGLFYAHVLMRPQWIGRKFTFRIMVRAMTTGTYKLSSGFAVLTSGSGATSTQAAIFPEHLDYDTYTILEGEVAGVSTEEITADTLLLIRIGRSTVANGDCGGDLTVLGLQVTIAPDV